jgi:hypothetical protein
VHPVLRSLPRHPFGELRETGDEVGARRETERALGQPDIRDAVADIASARLAGDLRRGAMPSHGAGQQLGDLGHRPMLATADVEDAAGSLGPLQRQDEGAGDIRDMHEVAPLLAVLEDHRWLAVVQARGEDRQYAGVGVRQRLARPVHIPQPQRNTLHPIGGRQGQGQAFLHVFGDGVDRGE